MSFTFRGTVKSPTGTVQTGTARVTALSPVLDTTGDVVFTGTSPQALVTGPPSFSFTLPDSSIASGYQLDVVDSNGAAVPFLSPVVFAAGAPSTTLDLSDVVGTSPVVAVPTTYTAVINYSGSGFPEGVVTAPVGSRYVDTAATSGAVEWTKVSGSGNTGWKVVSGDSGWRSLVQGTYALNGWTWNAFRVRRVNNVVMWAHDTLNGSTATNDLVMTMPSGFQADQNIYMAATLASGLVDTSHAYTLSNASLSVRGTRATANTWGNGSWFTSATWPSTLP